MCMTIKDAAEAIGYPTSTVAHAVRGMADISEAKYSEIKSRLLEIGFDRPIKERSAANVRHVPGLRWDKPITQQEACEMQKMHDAHISATEIAETFKCSKSTVFRHVNANVRNKRDLETAEYLRSLGFSNKQIAERLGVCARTVRNAIGCQPKEMSRNNISAGLRAYEIRRQARIENHRLALREQSNKIVLAYNEHKAKVEELRLQLAALENEDKAMRKEAKKALRYATIEIA